MKIYWSGAAIALMADVELRRRSDGEQTLDTVLAELQACCLPSDRTWSARELFSKLDTVLDEPLFMPLYERYADAPGFPDYRATFTELGIDIVGDSVRLNDTATLKGVREAITGTCSRTSQ